MPPRVLASGPKPCGGNNKCGLLIGREDSVSLSALLSCSHKEQCTRKSLTISVTTQTHDVGCTHFNSIHK